MTERVIIKKTHRVEKWDKPKQGPCTIVANLLNYKDKECILENPCYMKDTSYYVYKDFSKQTRAIRKSLSDEGKKLWQHGNYAVIKYDKIYCS